MKYTKKERNRIKFLMDKVCSLNTSTDYYAVIRIGKEALIIWVEDENEKSLFVETLDEIDEEKTYELYMKLDSFDTNKKESSTTDVMPETMTINECNT